MAQETARNQFLIGISDYKELTEQDYYYIGKTHLIVQVLDAGDQ